MKQLYLCTMMRKVHMQNDVYAMNSVSNCEASVYAATILPPIGRFKGGPRERCPPNVTFAHPGVS